MATQLSTPPQPFQVDNIADVWTIVSALGSLGAAVGTVAAFWVGAITYRRQVENDRAAQASKVTLFLDQGKYAVYENLGDLPIYSAMLMQGSMALPADNGEVLFARVPKDGLIRGEFDARMVDEGKMPCVVFTDSRGQRWIRYLDGTLKPERKKSKV